MKRKITINPQARIAHIPKELIDEGLKGECDAFANAVTLTIVKPHAHLADVAKSLRIVLQDVELRMEIEQNRGNPQDTPGAKVGREGDQKHGQ